MTDEKNIPTTEAGRDLLRKARTTDGWHTNFDAGDIAAIEQQARDEGRQQANAEWNSKEGTVWHYDCGLDEALKQARDEGRREAVREIRDAARADACTTLTEDWCADEDHIDRLHAALRVAGLNASESPPTTEEGPYGPVRPFHDPAPLRFGRDYSLDDVKRVVGDASESPSTATCCGHLPHGNGPCHGMVTDWGGERIPCDCDGRDASESGQPPDPEMTEANRESDADTWNSDR